MEFRDAQVAIDIMRKYTAGRFRDYGSEENRTVPMEGCFSFGHDQCWLVVYRFRPELTDEEKHQMAEAGWFWDEDNSAWSHF